MHYVLVWWFKEAVQPKLKGYAGLTVYADDFVVCFQHKEEAEFFYEHLKKRMEHFGLQLEESKSRLIEFGRYAQGNAHRRGGKAETFDFLGFTHYCSQSREGRFRVKRKTSRKKFRKKCKEIHALLKEIRHWKVKRIAEKLNRILVGYNHYYGIRDNYHALEKFRGFIIGRLYYWLNRRSQKSSYTWEGFRELLKVFPIVEPKIYVSVYER